MSSSLTGCTKFYNMKEIKQCPLKKEKCTYRTSRMSTLSGCSLYDNVNLCTKCAKYRKRQKEHTIKELKNTIGIDSLGVNYDYKRTIYICYK